MQGSPPSKTRRNLRYLRDSDQALNSTQSG
jgi:hypothetical protein